MAFLSELKQLEKNGVLRGIGAVFLCRRSRLEGFSEDVHLDRQLYITSDKMLFFVEVIDGDKSADKSMPSFVANPTTATEAAMFIAKHAPFYDLDVGVLFQTLRSANPKPQTNACVDDAAVVLI